MKPIKKNETTESQGNTIKSMTELMLLTMSEPERGIGMERICNARQLGGLKMTDGRIIKKDKLLRTANLHDASDNDVKRLNEEFHLKCIIDLRTPKAHQQMADRSVPGSDWYPCSLIEEIQDSKGTDYPGAPGKDFITQAIAMSANPKFQQFISDLYIDFVSSPYTQGKLSEAIHKILSYKGETVLWHCTQGKDRCGLLTTIVLSTLGADRNTVLEDFEVTNQSYHKFIDMVLEQRKDTLSLEAQETIRGLLGVNPHSLIRALDWIDATYGSMNQYLAEALKITKEEQTQLQNYYLK